MREGGPGEGGCVTVCVFVYVRHVCVDLFSNINTAMNILHNTEMAESN